MIRYYGKTVCRGIAGGPAWVLRHAGEQRPPRKIRDVPGELLRVEEARRRADQELSQLYERAVREIGKTGAGIFDIHRMLLNEGEFWELIRERICEEEVDGEYAVRRAGEYFSRKLEAGGDDYFQARAADIRDVAGRLARILAGGENKENLPPYPAVVLAKELTPSETMQMDKSRILALVTRGGSEQSHTAILARLLNIPAIVGAPLDFAALRDGQEVLVDGYEGSVTVEPEEEQRRQARILQQREREERKDLERFRGRESVTGAGRRVRLCANISRPEDVSLAVQNDAEGIGLLRSEFLYLGREDFPGEEEQFEAYRQVLASMEGAPVVIRTVDLGSDKRPDYVSFPEEPNPALGCRGIRICLREPELFKTQLRALLRAARCGNLSILYPMITSVWEVERVQALLAQASKELEARGIPHRIPPRGVMVETPAAALISGELAALVDFFSIGTNDLLQYTLALDRQNSQLEEFYQPAHPGLLKLVEMTVENAHRAGKWVGICGELAADLRMTETFLQMGVDELSVAPSMILRLRKKIRLIPKSIEKA